MKYHYQKVNHALSRYVHSVLVLTDRLKSMGSDLPLVTKGMPALLCRRDQYSCRITLFGQSVPDEYWAIQENTTLIAFFFKPFSIGPIFKLSAHELSEQPIELNHWHAKKSLVLHRQILMAKSDKELFEILNQFVADQMKANERDCELIRNATDMLMQNPDLEVATKLPEDFHLSERTFQRIFRKYVGTTPGQYRRICQFYFAFSQLKERHFYKQADVAYATGYFDQSHFIRSFKQFTDTTPHAYLTKGLSGKVR